MNVAQWLNRKWKFKVKKGNLKYIKKTEKILLFIKNLNLNYFVSDLLSFNNNFLIFKIAKFK